MVFPIEAGPGGLLAGYKGRNKTEEPPSEDAIRERNERLLNVLRLEIQRSASLHEQSAVVCEDAAAALKRVPSPPQWLPAPHQQSIR